MLSVSSIDIELKEHLGVDDNDISPASRLQLINRSFWEIAAKFDFREKEGTYTFNTVAGTKEYTVPGDHEAMQFIAVVDPSSFEHTQLLRASREDYLNRFVDRFESRSKPRRYYREDDKVIIDPTPDATYSLVMKYLRDLNDLISSGDVDLPREWHELILFGAVYRGFMRLNDLARAEYYRNQQTSMVNSTVPVKSKEEADSRYAAVSIVTRKSGHEANAPRRSLWKGYR